MKATFQKIKKSKDIQMISKLADEIWHEHYHSILDPGQIDYMVVEFQSEKAIADQIASGYEYYLIKAGNTPVGYIAIKEEEDRLFLSKLYLLKDYRGHGLGRAAFDFLSDLCKKRDLVSIWLTVNRNNRETIAIYRKMGFDIVRVQVADIGSGYVMDDYIMEKTIEED